MKFNQYLTRVNKDCPEEDKDKFLRYKVFKKMLKNCKPGQAGFEDSEARFFAELRLQLKDVNRHFATQAHSILEAHQSYNNTTVCGCFISPTGKSERVKLAKRAYWCRKFAKANAAALRKIVKKHDRLWCSTAGQSFLRECWRSNSESELGLILYSPLVDKLKAMQAGLRAPLHPDDPDLVERAAKAIHFTRADKHQPC